MRRWPGCIILCLIFPIFVSGQEELPFWRNKPKLLKQITDYRKVVVSVDAENKEREKKVRVVGVGAVNVPLYFVVEQIQRFEELTKVSSYFKKVKHNKDKQEVYFFIRAFGQQVRFIQKYQWGELKSDHAQMDWIVTWGLLKGMVGHYKIRRISPRKTEIAIWASMKKMDVPLPEFLFNFTLEVIAEKVAQKMRAYMEENYRKARRVQEKYVKKR